MTKKLIIFGANGALGKEVTNFFIQKDFDEVLLFDFNFDDKLQYSKVRQYVVKDLSIEENVMSSMYEIKTDTQTELFLFSTIGGFYGGQSVWEIEVNDLDRMFNLNFKTNFLIAKHFASIVKRSNSGAICFTSAFTSLNPEKLKFAYGASKSALNYLVKTLALEGSDINLSVNAIAPYIIDTPVNREWMKDADHSKWIKPAEIGEIVHSLFQNHKHFSGNIIELKEKF